jgi:hypothetical protein
MKKDRRGRSTSGPPFVQLHHYLLDSAAWASLSSNERAVYVAICRRYTGTNNGAIGLGVRGAALAAGVNKDTVGRCFKALVDRGFIECATPGGFNSNAARATEWRLTAFRCDRSGQPASKAFVRWRPENADARPKIRTPLSERFGQEPTKMAPPVRMVRTGTDE